MFVEFSRYEIYMIFTGEKMFNPSSNSTLTSENPLNLFDVLDAVTSLPVTHKPIDFWIYLVAVISVAVLIAIFAVGSSRNSKNTGLNLASLLFVCALELFILIPALSNAQNTKMMEYSNETFELAVKTLNSSEKEKQAVKEILETVRARGPLWESLIYPDHYDILLVRLYVHAVKNKFAWEDVKH